jgi:hypothetical protein
MRPSPPLGQIGYGWDVHIFCFISMCNVGREIIISRRVL